MKMRQISGFGATSHSMPGHQATIRSWRAREESASQPWEAANPADLRLPASRQEKVSVVYAMQFMVLCMAALENEYRGCPLKNI